MIRFARGLPYPLGTTVLAHGINFAVYSTMATRIDLCLFDPTGAREIAVLPMPAHTEGVWHGLLHGVAPGLVYGYRAHGQRSTRGPACEPAKLLLDPYARRLQGHFEWHDAHFGGEFAGLDNARWLPKAVVESPDTFDWQADRPPQVPLGESVFYEAHVRGATHEHPDVPAAQRGCYEGIGSPAFIEHLRRLGVTTVSLMPVHYGIDERPLVLAGRINYWGYNPLAWFVPTPRYARDDAGLEFRTMVRALHAAGIEVILDVVYNHTAEGDSRGPVLSWRGLDAPTYYRIDEDGRTWHNDSGCGNTVNLSHPRTLQLVMDSLRHWVTCYHVDGFRFDLAPVLGRGPKGFSADAPFFHAMAQDPILSRVKLVAEPWDIGPGGYQLGGFPIGWQEWNDRYRDSIRAFWIHQDESRGALATRLAGSSDAFGHGGRRPVASVNLVTAHDGFTLHDLVSYEHKHNQANGENNRDGHAHNLSANCGIEGPTDDPEVIAHRAGLKRALLSTLMLSRGVPMLLAGDELGRTQQGNNNAYCQDNPITWIDWARADDDLVAFVAHLTRLRREFPQLRGTEWLTGRAGDDGERDIVWLQRNGDEMHQDQWANRERFVFGMRVAGPIDVDLGRGVAVLVIFNADDMPTDFRLPAGCWREQLNSALPADRQRGADHREQLAVAARCVMMLSRRPPE